MMDDVTRDDDAAWEQACRRLAEILDQCEAARQSQEPQLGAQVAALWRELVDLYETFENTRPLPIPPDLRTTLQKWTVYRHTLAAMGTSPELLEWRAFVDRLKSRQGTVIPDFASLYRQQDALDDRLFSGQIGFEPPRFDT